MCSSKQLVLVHLFEDFHALQEMKLFLTSLLLGRHSHVLVSLGKKLSTIVSRVSVNTASAAIINDSPDTSAFVAESSNSSIGVVDARFAARSFLQHYGTFQSFLCLRVSTADCFEVRTFHTRSRRGFLCHRHNVVTVFVSL